jgi:hypothetical protein
MSAKLAQQVKTRKDRGHFRIVVAQMLPKLTKASTGYFVAKLAILSPWALSCGMYLSPINKCGVNLSGGQGYLRGLHATYFDLRIISATFRNF